MLPQPNNPAPYKLIRSKLLIICIFYNRSGMITESVESVVSQLGPDMHLLLVDDHSTDSTADQLRAWESTNVTVAVNERNIGFVNTLIHYINSSDSEYIAIHGSGDISLPGRFEQQRKALDDNPSVGVVSALATNRYVDRAGVSKPFGKPLKGFADRVLLKENPITHGAVMFRRRDYDRAGGYRDLFTFAQDRDLWCRMSRVCEFMVLDSALYTRMKNVSGSVSGSSRKVVMQKHLSHFAVFCHREVLAGRPDPLEQYGRYGLLLFSDRRSLRRDLFICAGGAALKLRFDDYCVYMNSVIQNFGGGFCSWAAAVLESPARFAFRLVARSGRKAIAETNRVPHED